MKDHKTIKLFLLSFPRNGTTSFVKLFLKDGFRATHETKDVLRFAKFDRKPSHYTYNNKLHSSELSKQLIEKLNQEKLKEYIDQYDIFTDFPWPLLYPYLVENYPEAYFVLSERDSSKWIQSMILFFQNRLEKSFITLYKIVFGSALPSSNKKKYVKIYLKWNNEIKKYFSQNSHIKFMNYNISENNEKIKKKIEKFTGLTLSDFNKENSSIEYIKLTKNIKDINFSKFDLKKYSFENCVLKNVDFQKSDLTEVNFKGANLTNCNFNKSILKNTDFSQTILQNCSFQKCKIDQANFNQSQTIKETITEI